MTVSPEEAGSPAGSLAGSLEEVEAEPEELVVWLVLWPEVPLFSFPSVRTPTSLNTPKPTAAISTRQTAQKIRRLRAT